MYKNQPDTFYCGLWACIEYRSLPNTVKPVSSSKSGRAFLLHWLFVVFQSILYYNILIPDTSPLTKLTTLPHTNIDLL